MQTIGPIQPEFDLSRCQTKTGPMRGAWNITFGNIARHCRHPVKVIPTVGQRRRLIRGRRTDLRHAGARMEIGVRFRRAHFFQRPFNANLPTQAFPVKQQRRLHIRPNFAALAAVSIGVEHEAIGAVPFQQHHADRGRAFRRGGGQRHCICVVRLRRQRFSQPGIENGERVGLRDRAEFVVHAPATTRAPYVAASRLRRATVRPS